MTHPQELGGGGVLGVGTTVVVPHEVGNGGGSRAMLIEKFNGGGSNGNGTHHHQEPRGSLMTGPAENGVHLGEANGTHSNGNLRRESGVSQGNGSHHSHLEGHISGSRKSSRASYLKYHESHDRRSHEEPQEFKWPDPTKYNPRSLGFFSLQNPLRKFLIGAIEWRWWDRTVLMLILLNTLQLGFIYNPFDVPALRPDATERDLWTKIGMFFNVCFMMECLCKVTAWGFCVGPFTYLRDSWNFLDFFIVIIGVLDFIPEDPNSAGSSNLSSLRSLRVMRPLRAVTKFPELRFLIVLLLQCVPMLSNVLGLCSFIFLVFGILGVQLFQGLLRGQCYSFQDGSIHAPFPCSLASNGGSAQCPANYECLLLGRNPAQGIVNFDSIGGAVMSIFQIMTLEGWNNVMYAVQDAHSDAMAIYFVVLVFLGPIFAVQLFLVVISTKFAETKESLKALEVSKTAAEAQAQEKAEDDEDENDAAGTRNNGNEIDPSHDGPGNEIDPSHHAPAVTTVGNGHSGDFAHTHSEGGADQTIKKKKKKKRKTRTGVAKYLHKVELLAKSEGLGNVILAAICLNTLTMAVNHDCSLGLDCPLDGTLCDGCPLAQPYCKDFKASLEVLNLIFAVIFILEALIKIVGLGPWTYFTNKANLFDMVIVVVSGIEIPSVVETYACLRATEQFKTICGSASNCTDDLPVKPGMHRFFPWCLDYASCESGGGAVMVLRTFRLVRIVKLLRAFPDVQKQVKIVVGILGSVAALIGLICIFLLIFCILGMNLFGGKLIEQWDPSLVSMGARVYVDIPGDFLQDDFPNQFHGRPGSVEAVDAVEHSSTPWKVYLWWGSELARLHPELGIHPDGYIWTALVDSAGLSTPAIVQVSPRMNFDNIVYAGITTFQVLTVANWNDDMYVTVASNGSAAAFFFVAIIVVGNWMLLNLFIAILIQGFAEQKATQLAENLQRMQEQFLSTLGGLSQGELATKMQELFAKMDKDGSGVIDKRELQKMLEDLEVRLTEKELTLLFRKYDQDGSGEIDFSEFLSLIKDLLQKAEAAINGGVSEEEKTGDDDDGVDAFSEAQKLHEEQMRNRELTEEKEEEPRSLFCLGPHAPIRRAARALITWKPFDNFILACILLSCVSLAYENPGIGDNSPDRAALINIDYFLNFSFLLECLGKITSLSFYVYYANGWNKLDLLIVTTSTLDMLLTAALSGQNVDLSVLKIFRIFRILRALRPLRIIARARGLRILVTTIMSATKPVLNTLSIAIVTFALFGILGMQLLSGKMSTCTDHLVFQKDDCRGFDDKLQPRKWIRADVHFDSLDAAVRALFILATQDDWPVHMWAGIDATSTSTGAKQNYALGLVIFYFASILVAGYLVINIFVGVFVDCYNSVAAEMEEPVVEKLTMNKIPPIFDDPEDRWRCAVSSACLTTSFDMFIAFFIVTNVLSMAVESWKQSQAQTDFSLVSNLFFTYVFGWECAIKLYGFYPRRYFSANWNRFDFFIVMVSYAGIAIDYLGSSVGLNPTVLRVLRVFRIFRILRAFRIFKSLKGLQAIISTLGDSLPALLNLFSMLGLVFFIFAVLGVTQFGPLCTDDDLSLPGLKAVRCLYTDPDFLVDSHASFKNIAIGILTLFRVATGDAWGQLLAAASVPGAAGLVRQIPVREKTWKEFSDLMGYDPSLLDHGDPEYFTRFDGAPGTKPDVQNRTMAYFRILQYSIKGWNASVAGLHDDVDWPFPASAPGAGGWVTIGRQVAPGCMSDEDIIALQKMSPPLVDCDTMSGYSLVCASPCGNYWVANVYFCAFVCIAAFVLLQLVIAVLMEQLNANEDEQSVKHMLMPGAETLRKDIFLRMYRRWQWNAGRKYKHKRRIEKGLPPQDVSTPRKRAIAVVTTLPANEEALAEASNGAGPTNIQDEFFVSEDGSFRGGYNSHRRQSIVGGGGQGQAADAAWPESSSRAEAETMEAVKQVFSGSETSLPGGQGARREAGHAEEVTVMPGQMLDRPEELATLDDEGQPMGGGT